MAYKEKQIGWTFISLMLAVWAVIAITFLLNAGSKPLGWTSFLVATALIGLVVLLFYQMKLETQKGGIRISYGIGWISIFLAVDRIDKTESIKTPWYWGLGIRHTPKGILYNIQSLSAVQIFYQVGTQKKTVMIGSKTPENLASALEKAFP